MARARASRSVRLSKVRIPRLCHFRGFFNLKTAVERSGEQSRLMFGDTGNKSCVHPTGDCGAVDTTGFPVPLLYSRGSLTGLFYRAATVPWKAWIYGLWLCQKNK